MRYWDGAAWLTPAGWYTDTTDGTPAFWGDRYWDGHVWRPSYERRWWARGHGEPSPNPTTAIAITALAVSVCSMVIPAVILLVLFGRVFGVPMTLGTFIALCTLFAVISLLSCVAAIIGFRAGIVARLDLRGSAAVVVSRVGGVFSAATLMFAGLVALGALAGGH